MPKGAAGGCHANPDSDTRRPWAARECWRGAASGLLRPAFPPALRTPTDPRSGWVGGRAQIVIAARTVRPHHRTDEPSAGRPRQANVEAAPCPRDRRVRRHHDPEVRREPTPHKSYGHHHDEHPRHPGPSLPRAERTHPGCRPKAVALPPGQRRQLGDVFAPPRRATAASVIHVGMIPDNASSPLPDVRSRRDGHFVPPDLPTPPANRKSPSSAPASNTPGRGVGESSIKAKPPKGGAGFRATGNRLVPAAVRMTPPV
jgi:hypothetical protein